MLELIATATITVSSALLFGYWFRYTCLLILNTKAARDYTSVVAMANQLQVLEVQSALPAAASADLDRLHQLLERDYKVLGHLFRKAGASGDGEIEERMLGLYYRVMGLGYGISRSFSQAIARKALEEMSLVVAHFANALGERTLSATAAA
jgi:hypothetical protein